VWSFPPAVIRSGPRSALAVSTFAGDLPEKFAVAAWIWTAVLYRLWNASLRVPIYQDRPDARLIANLVQNIQTRVDELSKKKIRFKVSKDELATAKTDLEWMKSEWAEATAASNAGRITAAAEKAKAIKAKGLEVEKTLGIESRELTASKE